MVKKKVSGFVNEEEVKPEVVKEEIGIKESKELLIGAMKLTTFIIKRQKDGWGMDDIEAAYEKWVSDPAFKEAMIEMIKGGGEIPKEIKDLDMMEGIELGSLAFSFVKKVIEVIMAK